jgi:hypothetical protein
MAKILEFYVRDLFPRTPRTGSTLGRLIELPRCRKQSLFMCSGEILSIETWERTQEDPIREQTMTATRETNHEPHPDRKSDLHG